MRESMDAHAGVRRVIVLGSTGSVGVQTLDVINHLNALSERTPGVPRFDVVGLASGTKAQVLHTQAAAWPGASTALSAGYAHAAQFVGPDAAEQLVRQTPCDLVVQAIVGAAGLRSTLAAIECGRDVALANKESLVVAGQLVIEAARAKGVRVLPLDSEHAALWLCAQAIDAHCCPPCRLGERVSRVVLTASGGPFRTWTRERMQQATAKDALAHPTWSMGPKITVDCATMMNKAFELVEAHWLFGLEPDRLGVLVHPQSAVHAMAELVDGSVVAQMSVPDMRVPIQQALTHPKRLPGLPARLRLDAIGSLTFEAPDIERFSALRLADRMMTLHGTCGAVVNAANEAAVGAFLAGRIGFVRIAEFASEAIDAVGISPVRSLRDVLDADREARRFVEASIAR